MPLPRLLRHPWMDDQLDAFREQVRRWLQRQVAPRIAQFRTQGFVPHEVWREFGALGFLLPELPEPFGGSGVSRAWQTVVQDELIRVGLPAITSVHSIAAHYILQYGSPEQQQRWLPALASGEHLAAIAMTEPGAGSDLKAMRTCARRAGDHYVVDGAKTFISCGSTCTLLVLACRTGGEGSAGMSLLVLETRDLPGFHVGRVLDKMGQHAIDTCELFFDGVHVPRDHLLGPTEGQGFRQLMSQLPYERMLVATPAATAIERAVELTREYAQQRKAFGQTLYDFQNTRFKLAEAATMAHVVRSFVNDCVQRLVDDTLDDQAAYMAKWWCTEQQCKVIDECLQLFGGYGYMMEYPISQLYIDARAQRIYGGTNEIMKELIARAL